MVALEAIVKRNIIMIETTKERFAGKDYVVGTTQLGKEVGISRVAAFKRIESGSIKATLVGNQYLIPWAEVMKLKKIIRKWK